MSRRSNAQGRSDSRTGRAVTADEIECTAVAFHLNLGFSAIPWFTVLPTRVIVDLALGVPRCDLIRPRAYSFMPLPLHSGRAASTFGRRLNPHKLSPPGADGLVSRHRLLNKMNQAPQAGTIAIVAAPFSGKTCLAATWMESACTSDRSGLPIWYQVDDADIDVAAFFKHLESALAEPVNSIASLPSYSAEAFANLKTFSAHWFRAFLKLHPLGPVFFVVDDVHRIDPTSPFVQVVAQLVTSLRDEDRVVLASRQALPAVVTRAARRRGVLLVTDLQVAASEFEDFKRDLARPALLTPQEFDAALRYSGNWVSGLPFLPQIVPGKPLTPDYMQNVLLSLSPDEQAALQATAYLQVGSEEDWTKLGGPASVAALKKVGATTGLVSMLRDKALRKHDLFFEHVQTWADLHVEAGDRQRLLAETGRLVLERGETLSGISLLIQADALDEAVTAILDCASDLIDHAKNRELIEAIERLPLPQKSRPALQVWQAYARLPFSPEEAARKLAAIRSQHGAELAAAELALAINGEIYAALADMAMDDRLPKLVVEADRLKVRLNELPEPSRSRLLLGRLIAMILGPPMDADMEPVREEAGTLLPKLTPESRLILGAAFVNHLLWRDGDVERARGIHHNLAAQARHPEAAHLPVISWYVGALGLAFRDGDVSALRSAADDLHDFARRQGLTHRLGPAYWVMAQALAAAGAREEAEKAVRQHLSCVEHIQGMHLAENHFLLAVLALSDDDLDRAETAAEIGTLIGSEHGVIHAKRNNTMIRAMALALKGDLRAVAAAEELAQVGATACNRIFPLHAALAMATYHHRRERWEAFEAPWREFLGLAGILGIRSISGLNRRALSRIAQDALARKIDIEGTSRLVTRWRLPPPPTPPLYPTWPYPIEINCLGTFELKVNGKLISAGHGKVQQQTLDILALLATAEFGILPQEVLVDEIWPDVDGDRAMVRARSAIYLLRKLIGRETVTFSGNAFILNSEITITDVRRLKAAMAALADENRGHRERLEAFDIALELYRGPLLPGVSAKHVVALRSDLAARLASEGAAFLDALSRLDPELSRVRRKRLAVRLGNRRESVGAL